MKKSNWTFLQQAHKAKLIREEDVDSGNYQGGLSTRKREHEEEAEPVERDDDAVLSDLSSSDEDAPQIKVPLSKDEALAAVQRSKVLKGLSIPGQVRVAALLRRAAFKPGEELWSGELVEGQLGGAEVQEKRLVLIESGEAELWLPEDGSELYVGLCGPTKVLGGLFAVGSASRQIFSVRVPEGEDARPLLAWEVESEDLEQFESLFHAADLRAFRRRVLQDLRIQLMPYLQRQLAAGGVFSRYSAQFIHQLVKDMDLRLFEPGQVIFKEKSLGRSLGILVSGTVDIIANGRKVLSKSVSGQEIGEAAIFENSYKRHATTRCSQSGECLMFLVSRDAFYACLAKFPEEKIKLAEQVRHRIAMTVMKEPFSMCDPAFLHLVCTECEVVQLPWPKAAFPPDQDEVMHLCYSGDLVVESSENGEVSSRFARKWEIFGLQSALGLRSGPADYKLLAGRAGCTLVRVTWPAVQQALLYFPTELPKLLALANVSHVPHMHPFKGKETLIWATIQPLLCRIFFTLDIDQDFCEALAPYFKASVYDAGCLITCEGVWSDSVVFLVSGEVTWSRQGIVSFDASAPDYFDELCLCAERGQSANITAKSTVVIWRLHRAALRGDEEPCRQAEELTREVDLLTQDIHGKLRSNMRNMKTWRRFNSEVLGLLSDNIFLRTYLPGQRIFSDGDAGEFIFILMRGRVEVRARGKTSYLEEGMTFGEMVLFGQANRSATITASCLCIINAVHKDLVSHALRMQPRKAFLVDDRKSRQTVKRVRGTEDRALRQTPRGRFKHQMQAPRGYEQRMPQQLQQRLERSFLLESRSPRLPPVEPLLYAAPKGTEMKLRRAFKGLVPREVLVASSNMRGVREGYLHRVKRIGLEDSLPSIRPPRATYTEPLPPLRHVPQAPHRLGALDMAVLGGLQALAASLLRLSSKPSIALLLDAQHAQRPPRPPPLPKLSSYAQSMERSRRAYAPTTPVQVVPSAPSPPVASPVHVERRSDSPLERKALCLVVRRMAYEAYEARMEQEILAILLSPEEQREALLQLEMYSDASGISFSGSEILTPELSEHYTPSQVSPCPSRIHSVTAEDVMAYLFDI